MFYKSEKQFRKNMKSYLAAALLGLSPVANAQLSTDVTPNSIRTNACTNYGRISSCLQSSARESGIDTKLTISSRIAGANIHSTFKESPRGLAASYELRNRLGSLRTNTLDGELETTNLTTRARDWRVGLQYEHRKESINATLQKDDLRILYSDSTVGADYKLGNWRFQSRIGEQDYSANALFELRF